MGFLDKLFGRRDEPETQQPQQYQQYGQPQQYQQGEQPRRGQNAPGRQQPGQLTDEQAIARYRYMLQTAPPETIEQAHAEAFERLTPEQRQMVLQQLSSAMPEHERRALGSQMQDDPRTLARMATRAEMRQPGTMERTFNNMPNQQGMGGAGIGMGGLMAGTFFSSFAGMFLGSMIAQQFFGGSDYNDGYADGQQEGEASNDTQDAGTGDTGDAGTDAGGYDTSAGGDYGSYGDSGGYGGDYGGGDFGGGDFGGGDFGGGDF
ncbi:MAG TPA: hypothetical protein VEW94_04220 [Chloroflexia bacterium]|nr:hypothetical protein [Chloroflexia bacterium]